MLTQVEIGNHLDMDQSSVSRLCADLGIDWRNSSMDTIRVAYIRRLREQAAGRAAAGDLDLAGERARLAKEQADRVAMQNAVTRGELSRTVVIEQVLCRTGAKMAGIFDGIPGILRRRFPELSGSAIALIAAEIVKVRNMVGTMSIDDIFEGIEEDTAVPPAPTFGGEGDASA
jgi:phage terminase Nu1 subunit (DNA packaging protein)